MKQCRVDAFVVGPKKTGVFLEQNPCYEWICIRYVSEGKKGGIVPNCYVGLQEFLKHCR